MEYISKKQAYDRLMFESSLYGLSFTAEAMVKAANIIEELSPEPDDRIKAIADHYGPVQQKEQLIEECSELILAAQKCKRNGTREAFDNYCEELADVYIMVSQLMYLISPDIIGSIVDRKLNRQMERIGKEQGNA